MARRHQNSNPFSLFSFQDIITATTGILILLALVLALSIVVQKSMAKPPNVVEDVSELQNRLANLVDEIEKLRQNLSSSTKDSDLIASLSSAELRNKLNSLNASIGVLQTNVGNQSVEIKRLQEKFDNSKLSEKIQQLENELAELEKNSKDVNKDLKDLQSENRVVYNFRSTTSPPFLVEIDNNSFKTAKANVKQKAKVFNTAKSFVDFAKGIPESERYFVLLVKPSGISNYDLLRPYLEQMDADLGIELFGENEIAVDDQTGGAFK